MLARITSILVFATILLSILIPTLSISAQGSDSEARKNVYFRARVTKVLEETESQDGFEFRQRLNVLFLEGPEKGKETEVQFVRVNRTSSNQKIRAGETIIIISTIDNGQTAYFISDKYRNSTLIAILAFFVILSIVVARWRGFMAIVGLVVSIFVLLQFVLPSLISGGDPLTVSFVGAVIIATISMYLAHGFKMQTTTALFSTLFTISVSVGLSILFVEWAKLNGLGSEEAYFLQSGIAADFDVKGLLLGGIIIGTLGILDDITVSQVAIVRELHDVDNNLSILELFKRGLRIGREHIASLINTLALAYVGVSFPLILSFSVTQGQPLWVVINSEPIAEEVVRTMIGSITLVLAVPIATIMAAYSVKNPFKIRIKNKRLEEFYNKLEPKSSGHSHSHHHHFH